MQKVLLAISTFLFSCSAMAYNKKDFVCPLTLPEFKPLMSSYYPEALKKNEHGLRFTWTKALNNPIEAKQRTETVADLYALAKKEIETSISIFVEPNSEISSQPELNSFFERFVELHSPKLNIHGELRKKDAKLCRQEALSSLLPPQAPDSSSLIPSEPEDPMAELSAAISRTCFNHADFNQCLKQVSKSTLMCVSPAKRTKMSTDINNSYVSFKKIIEKQSAKLATKPNLAREAHYQIRLLLSLFPKLADQYLALLSSRGTGVTELRVYADKLYQHQTLSADEEQTMRKAMDSIVQICRVDFLMDVRETFKDVLTWTSVGLTVASLAFGPVFGIALLPMVLNSSTTIGFLVGINVISQAMSVIDGILTSKDMRSAFDQGKISQALFKVVRYQKSVLDNMITKIQDYKTKNTENILSEKDEDAAKKALIGSIKLSTEYQSVIRIYSNMKAAKFNRVKQAMCIFLFAMSIPTTVVGDQALFNAIGNVSGSGRDAIRTLQELRHPSAAFPALSNTRTVMTISLTASSLINSLVGMSRPQIRFVREALDSIFILQP